MVWALLGIGSAQMIIIVTWFPDYKLLGPGIVLALSTMVVAIPLAIGQLR